MPYILHRDELEPKPSMEVGWRRYDLLGEKNINLVSADLDLVVLNPGETTPEHFHAACEHYIFVLRGEGFLELDGETHPIAQNYVISIESEERHVVRNAGVDVLEMLEFKIPS